MAYREIAMVEVKEVLRLWLMGVPKKRIAQQLGLDVKTVRRHLAVARVNGVEPGQGLAALDDRLVAAVVAAGQPASDRPHGEGWAVCEVHREFIAKHLENGVRLTKIRKLLQRQGAAVFYPTLYRFAVTQLDFGRGRPTLPVADCEPGAEVQVDTGWMTLLEPDLFGDRRRFRAWIFTPVLSRYRFVYPVFRETTETAIEACEAAWAFYGGVFHALIPDSSKAIVAKADSTNPKITEAFLEYAQARGFVIDTARIRHPRDKARVERTVPTVREDCFRGERLQTLEDARVRALVWCRDEYGMRRHSRTQRLPREYFESVEKKAVKPAPAEPYDVPLWCDCTPGLDQLAVVAKAFYSLPPMYRRRRVRARADHQLVRFYDHGKLMKTLCWLLPSSGSSITISAFPRAPQRDAFCSREQACFASGGLAWRSGVQGDQGVGPAPPPPFTRSSGQRLPLPVASRQAW